MQDDDDFDTLRWVDDAITLFQKFPNMVILGGCGGYTIDLKKKKKRQMSIKRKQCTNFKFLHFVDHTLYVGKQKFFYKKISTHIVFFCSFMGDDQELCLRSWLNGLLVGWYNCPFKSLSAGGMRIEWFFCE